MDSKHYPTGKGGLKSRYVSGSLVFYTPAGVEIYRINPITGAITYATGSVVNIATGSKLQNNGVDMDLSAGIATSTTASTAELNRLAAVTPGTTAASKALVVGSDKNLDVLALPVSGLKIGAGAGTAVSATAAELNTNAGVTAGTVTASKSVVVNSAKSVDVVQATTALSVGGTGVPGAAAVNSLITKAVAAFTDTVAKDVFTVTVPNAVHAAVIEVDLLGVLGAGGAIGAGEATRISKYQVVLARTAGVATVVGVSSAIGGAAANVAGATSVASVVATASAMTGAAGAQQTFTILAAITKTGGASDNHTLVASARILNQNATGVTIA